MAELTNEFGVADLSNYALTMEDVPAPGSEFFGVIDKFALTFDGYSHCGDRCGDIANKALQHYEETGKVSKSLIDLRTCLFYEQRRWHHFAEEPDDAAMEYIHALVEAIRETVAVGNRS